MSPYLGEFIGTTLLVLFGDGVVANVVLSRTKGHNSGWIVITTGWGLGVLIGAYAVGTISGAQLNPAVTLSLAASGKFEASKVAGYLAAQFAGAFLGAVLVWLSYWPRWKETTEPATKLGDVLHRAGDSKQRWEFLVRSHRHRRLGLWGTFDSVEQQFIRPRLGYRLKPHRLRHQSRARLGTTPRSRAPSDCRQRRIGLGLCVDPGARTAPRRSDRSPAVLPALGCLTLPPRYSFKSPCPTFSPSTPAPRACARSFSIAPERSGPSLKKNFAKAIRNPAGSNTIRKRFGSRSWGPPSKPWAGQDYVCVI